MSSSPDLQHPVSAHRSQSLVDGIDQPAPGALPALICVWCDGGPHVIRDGSLPASHGLCRAAYARESAQLDAIEAGRASSQADPIVAGHRRVIEAFTDLLLGGIERERRVVQRGRGPQLKAKLKADPEDE